MEAFFIVWSVNDGLSGDLWKPAVEVSGRCPDSFVEKKIEKNYTIKKPAGNLRGRFPDISSGFLDNVSLTDHTVVQI